MEAKSVRKRLTSKSKLVLLNCHDSKLIERNAASRQQLNRLEIVIPNVAVVALQAKVL